MQGPFLPCEYSSILTLPRFQGFKKQVCLQGSTLHFKHITDPCSAKSRELPVKVVIYLLFAGYDNPNALLGMVLHAYHADCETENIQQAAASSYNSDIIENPSNYLIAHYRDDSKSCFEWIWDEMSRYICVGNKGDCAITL